MTPARRNLSGCATTRSLSTDIFPPLEGEGQGGDWSWRIFSCLCYAHGMLGLARKSPGRLKAIDRVEEWTRERFGLARGSAVHVWEIACAVPRCPPLETVVGVSIAGPPHHGRGFTPHAQG